ncbi:hypothetical protein ACJX0J_008386, partial [Zea mays]
SRSTKLIQQTANLFSTTLFEAFSKKEEMMIIVFDSNLFGNLSNAQCLYDLFQNYHGHGNVLGQDFYFSNRITVSLAGLSFLLDEKDHMLVVISWTTSTSWGDMYHVNLVLLCYNEDCAADHFGALVVPFLKTDLRSDPYFVLVFVHFGSEQRANLQMFLGSKIYYALM